MEWGKGYASQALRKACSYAKKYLKLKIINAGVAKPNSRSIKVLEKNNFFPNGIKKKTLLLNNNYIDELLYVKFL